MRSETAVVKKMSKNTHIRIRIRILLCYGIIITIMKEEMTLSLIGCYHESIVGR